MTHIKMHRWNNIYVREGNKQHKTTNKANCVACAAIYRINDRLFVFVMQIRVHCDSPNAINMCIVPHSKKTWPSANWLCFGIKRRICNRDCSRPVKYVMCLDYWCVVDNALICDVCRLQMKNVFTIYKQRFICKSL